MRLGKNNRYMNFILNLLALFRDAYIFIFFIYIFSLIFSFFSETWKANINWYFFNMVFEVYTFLAFVYLLSTFKKLKVKDKTNLICFILDNGKKMFLEKRKIFFKIFVIFVISFFLVLGKINLIDHIIAAYLMAVFLFSVDKKSIFLIALGILFICFATILFELVDISLRLNTYAFYCWIAFLISLDITKEINSVDNLVANKKRRVIIKLRN